WDADAVALRATIPGGLRGRKLFVHDAHVADAHVVSVREAAGVSLLVIPGDRAGVARLALDTLSGDKLFELTFDDVAITADDRLGRAGDGARLLVPALAAGGRGRAGEGGGAGRRGRGGGGGGAQEPGRGGRGRGGDD